MSSLSVAVPHLLLAIASAAPLTGYVDPFVATRGGGGYGGWGAPQLSPGAMFPFPGMRLGPDTTRLENGTRGSLETWTKLNRKAGYFGSDNAIRAFSHTRMQGAGVNDYGSVGVMVVRDANLSASVAVQPIELFDLLWLQRSPFASGFNFSSQIASPGYYSVELADAATTVQLAVAGRMSGIHRYTCNYDDEQLSAAPCTLVLDACHSNHNGDCGNSTASVAYDSALGGYRIDITAVSLGDFSGPAGVKVYFSALVTISPARQPSAYGLWSDRKLLPSGTASGSAVNNSLGVFITVPSTTPQQSAVFTVRAGISWTGAADAWTNVLAEQQRNTTSTAAGQDTVGNSTWLTLEDAAAAADTAWEEVLSAVSAVPAADSDGANKPLHFTDSIGTGNIGDGAKRTVRLGSHAASEAISAYLSTVEGAIWAIDVGLVPLRIALEASSKAKALSAEAALVTSALKHVETVEAALAAGSRPIRKTHIGNSTTLKDLAVFYTSLYHSFCAPSTYSNTGRGSYLGMDGVVRTLTSPQKAFYSDLSLWDIYRTQAPLMSLLLPAAAADVTQSLLLMAQQCGGTLPTWPFASRCADNMAASHGIEVMLDCLLKGACGASASRPASSAAAIYNATMASMAAEESADYLRLGYFPFETNSTGSLTLEVAINDASSAKLAQLVGDAAGAAAFGNRSRNYRNVWQPSLASVIPRFSNGSFMPLQPDQLSYPYPFNRLYTEGDSLQWQWAVPQDVPGLVSLFPSTDAYAATLHAFLANQTHWIGNGTGPGTALPNPYYWAGNEPNILAPFQFAWAGANHSWRGQFWPRWLLDTFYTADEDGLPGNDDYGTMSAWGVWAHLGLYPLAGSTTYILASPVFADVTLAVPPAWDVVQPAAGPSSPRPLLRILAHNASSVNIFVARAAVNGVPLPQPLVDHAQLFPPTSSLSASGSSSSSSQPAASPSVLEFWMSAVPVPWGTGAS